MFALFRKSLALAGLAAMLPHAALAAGPIDMGTTTCQDWIDASDDEQDLMIGWLRGYAAGRATSTLFAPSHERVDRSLLMAFCRGHVTMGLISAGATILK